MCGIAGIVSGDGRPVGLGELGRMCSAMFHRGPDEDGYYVRPGVGLGMCRLRVIDLVTGNQPVHNEARSVWTVLNGEIYNYRDLRTSLEGQGHRFYTQSDTESIVHLYEQHGDGFAERLRGMFGLAIWDEREKKLTLARDRLGIKPLYYVDLGGRFAFASELKALLELADVERRLNWESVSRLFTSLTTPADESIIDGVRKLEPGHVLTLKAGQAPRVRRYWDLDVEPDESLTEADVTAQLRSMLEAAVDSHLVSDVPLGAFLSGGVDSSTIVALMSRKASGRIKTFSVGFNEDGYDETRHARRIAEEFGTIHHELTLDPNALDLVEEITWHLDEPFGDSSAIPTYMVSKLASEHVTVVLSGDGGDELFAGYDKYRVERHERARDAIPSFVRRPLGAIASALPPGTRGRNFLMHAALSGAERYLDASTLFRWEEKRRLFTAEAAERMASYDPWLREAATLSTAGGDWLSRLQRVDMESYLPLDILTKVDRMSAAHSIETRVPLLDHELVEFVNRIPSSLKLKGDRSKHIMKRAMEDLLPPEILDRPKQGFAVPLDRWFRGNLSDYVRDLLLSSTSRSRRIFRPEHIERLLAGNASGRNLDLHLWTLISFETWCRMFLDRSAPPKRAGGWAATTIERERVAA